MEYIELSTISGIFIAGLLTFLAPCTLPLIPGYISILSGLEETGPDSKPDAYRIYKGALFFVLGFNVAFVLVGMLGFWIVRYIPNFKEIFTSAAGLLIVIMGLLLLIPSLTQLYFRDGRRLFGKGAHEIPLLRALSNTYKFQIGHDARKLPFTLGFTFALGWSPCVGPLLGLAFTAVAVSESMLSGFILLQAFSLGLSIPFLLTALFTKKAMYLISKSRKLSQALSIFGAFVLIGLGSIMFLNRFNQFNALMFDLLDFINYTAILQYL